MKTHTSKLKSLCKIALAASMLLGAAQWANAADAPVADTKPSVQKGKSATIPVEPPSAARGIKDPGVKSCGSCGMTGKAAAPTAGAAEGKTTPSAERTVCSGQWHYVEPGMCANAKGIRKGSPAE